jgi:hypothetical protein
MVQNILELCCADIPIFLTRAAHNAPLFYYPTAIDGHQFFESEGEKHLPANIFDFSSRFGTISPSSTLRKELEMRQLIRPLLIAGIGAIATAALIAIFVVLTGEFGSFQLKVLATVAWISFYSFTSAATFGEGNEYKVLGTIGAFLAIVGLVTTLPTIWMWDRYPYSESTWKAIFSIGLLSFAVAHATMNYRLSSKLPTSMSVMAFSNVVVTIVTGLLLYLILVNGEVTEVFWKFLISSAILDVALTLINFMVARITSRHTAA